CALVHRDHVGAGLEGKSGGSIERHHQHLVIGSGAPVKEATGGGTKQQARARQCAAADVPEAQAYPPRASAASSAARRAAASSVRPTRACSAWSASSTFSPARVVPPGLATFSARAAGLSDDA